jgi:UDP-galactopyranose mutase
LTQKIIETPKDLVMLESFENIVKLLVSLSFPINLWKTQNLCYQLMNKVYREIYDKASDGDASSKQWIKRFDALAATLFIRVPSN